VVPGNAIAIPAFARPRGTNMLVTESRRPTHRVYAVRKVGDGRSYWAEIGAGWANKDGRGLRLKFTLMPVGEADIVVREIDAADDASGRAADFHQRRE
jgi:hypothetical protein